MMFDVEQFDFDMVAKQKIIRTLIPSAIIKVMLKG